MKFSILICSLQHRKNLLNRLMSRLKPQLGNHKDIEILFNIDDGRKTIGRKRNELLKKAVGRYVAFIDDDDLVANCYIDEIMKGIDKGKDSCSLKGTVSINNQKPKIFIHSIKYNRWFEKGGIYYRPPNHLNVIKRELALLAGFPDRNKFEDRVYSRHVKKYIKSEFVINKTLYYYLYRSKK